MANSNEQAKLATQVKTGQIRDANESFSQPMALETIAKSAKAKRNSSNHYVLREEYLTDALNMMAVDFEKQGHPLPMPIRVSLSKANAKRTLVDDKKPYAFQNSKTWGALVTVQKNTVGEFEIFVNNEIEDTQAILASLYASLILTIVGPTHYADADKKAKFPNGELTFKSDQYDELANKLGILGKYRGNLVSSKTDSLSRILIKIQDALGPCPITPILVDATMKSGLKQSATNFKAVCENALCDARKEKDSKGETDKPFSIANISAFQAGIMEKYGAKLPCPICNPNADPKGSFLRVFDPKAEAEAKKIATAQKVIADAAKAEADKVTAIAKAEAEEQARADAIAKDKKIRDDAIAQAKAEHAAKLEAEKQAKEAKHAAKIAAKEQATPEPEKAPLAAVVANNVATTGKGKSANKGKAS